MNSITDTHNAIPLYSVIYWYQHHKQIKSPPPKNV